MTFSAVPCRSTAPALQARPTDRLPHSVADRLRVYRRILCRDPLLLAGALTCGILTLALRLPMPMLTGYVIDVAIARARTHTLDIISLALAFLTFVYLASDYLYDYQVALIRYRVGLRFQARVLKQLLRLPLSYLEQRDTGYLLARITDDPGHIQGFFVLVFQACQAIVTFVIGVVFLWMIQRRLALMCIASVPLFVGSFWLTAQPVKRADTITKDQRALVFARLKEALDAIRVSKLYSLDRLLVGQFLAASRQALRSQLWLMTVQYGAATLPNLILMLAPLAVLWIGGHQVISGELTIGRMVAFNALLAFLYSPARTAVSTSTECIRSVVSLDRLFELLDEPTETQMLAPAEERGTPSDRAIEFRNVSFGYSGHVPLFHDLNVAVRDGESVGLVGRTGSGKTTIINLMAGLYLPLAGEVRVRGRDIRTFSRAELRRTIGVLPQEPFVFSTTILENIRVGRPSATVEDVHAASVRAGIHEAIVALPNGYATQAGEAGCKLSGGQRQLVCLARLLLREPDILVFDEPTAAFDGQTEASWMRAMATLRSNKTVVIASHRPSTLMAVESVISITECGVTKSTVFDRASAVGAC